ncbi:unnamed protein product, partial [Allacma fusca]
PEEKEELKDKLVSKAGEASPVNEEYQEHLAFRDHKGHKVFEVSPVPLDCKDKRVKEV